ncbi:MAG: hypothetical protein CSB13_08895 [Chloroflexi bacterium]|nr:MAG: hypothetical protein CSB13_08895 [Chloroflexota bacterium]
MHTSNPKFGRILRASTTGFALGCRVGELQTPAFGSLVKAQPVDEREAIYGLIYDMHVDDDPLVRRLVLAENPPEAVINDQRDNRLLPIEMSVLAVGYTQNGTVRHSLPPRPPLNLDPVALCLEQGEIIRFTDNLGYLRLILHAQGSHMPVEQLLVAHITQVHRLRGNDNTWAMGVINELIELLRANYDVLIPTLEAVSDALALESITLP